MGRTPLSAKLKSARLQAGLTQKQLAELIHCSRTAIADYERGRSEPDPERLAAIAKATNVPLTYFLSGPVLFDGEPIKVLTPAQVVDIQHSRRGPPRSGGWTMLRPERWCDRLGAIVWVEVTADCGLAAEYEPRTVLGIAQGNLIHGCKVVLAVENDLTVGELVEDGPRWRVLTPSGQVMAATGRQIVGSVVARIEPAAADVLSEKPRARKKRGRAAARRGDAGVRQPDSRHTEDATK